MAVYRKKLLDKDGNTIIPAVGDIYGTVYTATLSSATAGGRADYDFTPDTPVENNKVYAVMFPAPTVNNATVILGDGVVSGSILVPPVSATDSPNYELLTTDMINDTEPLLLMYSGVQWVCLNQKKKVATADLEDNAVKSSKIDWTTMKPYWRTLGVYNTASITIPRKYKHFRMFIRVQAAANTARLVINSPDRANSNCWCNYYGVNASNEIHGAFNQPYTAGSGIAVAYIEPVNNNIAKMFFATVDSFVYSGAMRSIVHMNSAGDDIGCTIRSEAVVNITDAGLRLTLVRGNATLTNIEWVVEVLEQ